MADKEAAQPVSSNNASSNPQSGSAPNSSKEEAHAAPAHQTAAATTTTATATTQRRQHRRGKSYEGARSPLTPRTAQSSNSSNTNTGAVTLGSESHAADTSNDTAWQLLGLDSHSSSSSSGGQRAGQFSAADSILRALLLDFTEHTQQKLEEIMKFGIDEKFFLWDIFEADPKMHQLITAMSELAKYHVSVVIDALLRWRSTQIERVNAAFKTESAKAKLSRDASLMEERNRLAIEFLFCSAVLPILDCVGARLVDMLKPELCSELENVAFLYFRAPPEGKNTVVGLNLDISTDFSRSTLDLNRKKIPTLYAKLLGTLSRFRLRDIAPRFLKEITSNSVRSRKAVFVIQAIRFVRIQLPSPDGPELASMFVPALLELFKASQRFEVKSALAELVLRLLRPHILLSTAVLPEEGAQGGPHVESYSQWFKLVLDMYFTKVFHYKKKPKVNKELLANLLMKTAFLVALKKADFLQHFWTSMLQLLELLKESKATATALECILVLLEAYLLKCGDNPSEPIDQRLEEIASQVFSYVASKRSFSALGRRLGKGDPADIFVDIICVIARARLRFAMENIIFKMLSVSGKESFQAERVMVAVLAAREIWTAAAEHRPLQVSKARLKGEPPNMHANVPAGAGVRLSSHVPQLGHYIEPMAVSWWQLLTYLDNAYGNLLYSTHSKPLLDLIRPEKDGVSLELLRTTIFSIPTIMPKTDDQRLVRLLSKYLIHLDRGIGEMATGALSRLMAERPHFRPLIIHGVSEFVLAIPHNRHDLVFTLLFKLGQLLKRWVEILRSASAEVVDAPSCQQQLDTFSIDKVEGTALIFLCSPRAKIRLLALEILRSVRSVETELVQLASGKIRDSSSRPPIRIMDILDEVGSDIFKFLQKEQTSFLKSALAQPLPLTVKTLERLAARESKEDQLLWCHALAELLRYVSFSHPAPSLYACSLILSRFQSLQPEDSDPRLFTVEQEEMACWWRNYIVFACATIPLKLSHQLYKFGLASSVSTAPSSTLLPQPTSSGGVVSFITSGVSAAVGLVSGSSTSSASNATEQLNDASASFSSPEGNRDTPTTIKELLAAISPLLKSSSEVHREAAVMALQRTNAACYETLFQALRPFEKEFFGDYDKKKKTKRDRLRMVIMSIYTHIAEYARPGTLVANMVVKSSFVAFVQDTVMFFATNKNMFEHVSLRYQFTILARRLAEELHSARGEGTFEDDHLRKTIFYVFKKWCGPEVINDEATRKHLNTVLSAVKDPEKRQAYVTALRQHVLAVQLAAFQAMTACLVGPHFEAILPSDSFFPFIHSFLKNSHDRVRYLARLMLEAFLQGNLSQPHVLQITLNYCFSADPDIASNYFLCLVELFPEESLNLFTGSFTSHVPTVNGNVFGGPSSPLFTVLLHLVVYMMGDSDYLVRRNAHELLLLIKSLAGQEDRWQNVPFVIESSLHENYERAQLDLSLRLADAHGEHFAPEFVHEMVSRLDSVGPRARRQMLRYSLPWIAKLDLVKLSRHTLDIIVYDLLLVTLKFESELRFEAEQTWAQIAAKTSNVSILINKLLQIGIEKQNPDFIPLAKLICVYCARRSPKAVVDALVAELTSSSRSEMTENESMSTQATTQPHAVSAAITAAAALLDGSEVSPLSIGTESPRRGNDLSAGDDIPLVTTGQQRRRLLRRALSSREGSRDRAITSATAGATLTHSPSSGAVSLSTSVLLDEPDTQPLSAGHTSLSSSPSSAPLAQSPLATAIALESAVEDDWGSRQASPRDDYSSDYSVYSQNRRASADAANVGISTPGGWATSEDESSQHSNIYVSHPFHRLVSSMVVPRPFVAHGGMQRAQKPRVHRQVSPNRRQAQGKKGSSSQSQSRPHEEDERLRSDSDPILLGSSSRTKITSGSSHGGHSSSEDSDSASDTANSREPSHTPSQRNTASGAEQSSDSSVEDEKLMNNRWQRSRAGSDASDVVPPGKRPLSLLEGSEEIEGGWGLTRGHFTLVILAQLTYESSQCFREHLPIIFHLAFLGLDYRHVLVYEHCRIILLNVIHALVVVPLASVVLSSPSVESVPPTLGTQGHFSTSASATSLQSSPPTPEQYRAFDEGLELERYLKAHANKQLWNNEDIALKKPDIKSAHQVATLASNIVSVLKGVGIDLAEPWAVQALSWAVNCPSWHISGRSFQIFRSLGPSLTRDAQNDLLECLLRALVTSKRTPRESLPQSIEILLTLQSLVKAMSSQKLILFPQIFWAAAALLRSDYEQHFLHACQLLLDLIERINFGDRYVQNVFGASVPKDWQPSYPGLQPLVIRGLFSEANEAKSVQLLSSLTLLPYSELIHPDCGPLSRLLTNVLVLLPYICSNFRPKTASSVRSQDLTGNISAALVADRLSQACAAGQRPQLAAMFSRVAKPSSDFNSADDLLQELKGPLGRAIQQEAKSLSNPHKHPDTTSAEVGALTLLFSLLESGPVSWRKSLLTIIFNFLSFCVQNNPVQLETLLQPTWVATLLKMVSSSTWRQALPLLDLILQKSSLSLPQVIPEGPPTVGGATHPPAPSLFSNKPDRGVRIAAIAIDKLLSTEQRRRMASIDRTVFSVFGSADQPGIGADDESSRLTTEQQINYLLNATVPSGMQQRVGIDEPVSRLNESDLKLKPSAPLDDDDESDDESEELDLSTATINKGTFGRFPTFRGFEELLAKLEAYPNRSSTEDVASTSPHASSNARSEYVDSLEDSKRDSTSSILPSAAARSSLRKVKKQRWDADESTDEDNKFAAPYRRVRRKIRSSSGDVASVNRRALAAVNALGQGNAARRAERPSSKGKALSARNSSQLRQYLSNDFDPKAAVALSPYSTMRKKLSFSFSESVLSATRHWRDVQQSPTTQDSSGQALFEVFPAATGLVAALRDDFGAAIAAISPSGYRSAAVGKVFNPELLFANPSRLREEAHPVPDTVLHLVMTKYKRKLKRNPSFAQSFREQRAKLIEDINRLQMAYIEKRIISEDARRELAAAVMASKARSEDADTSASADDSDDNHKSEDMRPILELNFAVAVVELHHTLLKLFKSHNRMKELVNDILQSQTDTADVQEARSRLDADADENRRVAQELRDQMIHLEQKRESTK